MRHGLQCRLCDRRIRRAHYRVPVPGDGEHYAPVARVGHHDGALARQKGTIENQVDSLAGRDQGRSPRLGHRPDLIRETDRWR